MLIGKDQKIEALEKEKTDLHKQLRRARTITEELKKNAKKMKFDLFGKVDYISKEQKKTKKKLVESEKNDGEVTTEQNRAITERDKVIIDHNQLKDDLEYIQQQMHDISGFGNLALDGIPRTSLILSLHGLKTTSRQWLKSGKNERRKGREMRLMKERTRAIMKTSPRNFIFVLFCFYTFIILQTIRFYF